jgi:1,4-alpha-glucan branching enzyme
MGWMNDTLQYMRTDPLFRKGSHHNLTFPLTYFFSENFILPLSHDEVVHGKGSLINKMPGQYEDKFANLRAYLAYMMAHPGKKLLFMGGELAQFSEWDYKKELDWNLLDYEMHRKFHEFIKELNHFYLGSSELWEQDDSWEGFQWINPDDSDHNVIPFRRIDKNGNELIVACNFSPVDRKGYRIETPKPGIYKPVFHSGLTRYGGVVNEADCRIPAESKESNDSAYSFKADLPGLATIFWSDYDALH